MTTARLLLSFWIWTWPPFWILNAYLYFLHGDDSILKLFRSAKPGLGWRWQVDKKDSTLLKLKTENLSSFGTLPSMKLNPRWQLPTTISSHTNRHKCSFEQSTEIKGDMHEKPPRFFSSVILRLCLRLCSYFIRSGLAFQVTWLGGVWAAYP